VTCTQRRSPNWPAPSDGAHDIANATLQPPATWTGFGVELRVITFWRADTQGPSQRVRFTRDGGAWQSEVLPG
jgi:pyridoxamine 5'-phosphate oxidase